MSIRSSRSPAVLAAVPGVLLSLAGSAAALGAGAFGAALNLSAINGTNGFVINGTDASDYSGVSVSSAGDINGDGIDDLIIGAYQSDPNGVSGAGETYIVFGRNTAVAGAFPASFNLSTLNGTNGFVINGIDATDLSGAVVSNAGDINGDGVGDIIIGASYADPNGLVNAGESYIVFGKMTSVAGPFAPSINLSSLNGTTGFVLNGLNTEDRCGTSVSGAGDVNGDGVDDFIIGARFADPNLQSNAGESYVVFGKRTSIAGPFPASFNLSTLNGTNGFVIQGIDASDQCGVAVSDAGDFNGDGVGDVIIGALGGDPNAVTGAGESYIVFGKNTSVAGPFAASINLSTLNGTTGVTLNGIDPNDMAGGTVSVAGDINGDGVDDIIIGAMYGDPNGQATAGECFVVFGRDTAVAGSFPASLNLSTLNGATGFVLNGIDTGDLCGVSVSAAGDANGDGIADLIIGASLADPHGRDFAGESYVLFGRDTAATGAFPASFNLSALDGTTGFLINGIDGLDLSGAFVSAAGDINDDGIGDLIIGARGSDPNGVFNAGESFVVFGRAGQVWTSTSSGSWSTGSRWLSGVAPSRGTVKIEPTIGVTVTGPSFAAFLDSLTLGATFGRTTLDLTSSSMLSIEHPFTVPASAALSGSGVVVTNSTFTNAGTIEPKALIVIAEDGFLNNGLVDLSPAAIHDPAVTVDLYGQIENSEPGTILMSLGRADLFTDIGLYNAGDMQIAFADARIFGDVTNLGTPNGGGFTPRGTIDVIADSFALFTDDVTNQSAIVVDAGSSLAIMGTLFGNGISGPGGLGTAGAVFLGGGVSPGFSPGIARFDGDATLGGTAITTIEIGGTTPGTGHDQILVAGVLGAAGTLRINLINGYTPQGPASFKVLDFGSVIGTFSVIELDAGLIARHADTSTLLIDGIIRIPAPACAGDINGDGFTNASDFTILAGNFGSAVAPNTGGDLNGDGLVNAADFVILAGDFGCGG